MSVGDLTLYFLCRHLFYVIFSRSNSCYCGDEVNPLVIRANALINFSSTQCYKERHVYISRIANCESKILWDKSRLFTSTMLLCIVLDEGQGLEKNNWLWNGIFQKQTNKKRLAGLAGTDPGIFVSVHFSIDEQKSAFFMQNELFKRKFLVTKTTICCSLDASKTETVKVCSVQKIVVKIL